MMDSTIGSWENFYETQPDAEQFPDPSHRTGPRFGLADSSGVQGVLIDDFFSCGFCPNPRV